MLERGKGEGRVVVEGSFAVVAATPLAWAASGGERWLCALGGGGVASRVLSRRVTISELIST